MDGTGTELSLERGEILRSEEGRRLTDKPVLLTIRLMFYVILKTMPDTSKAMERGAMRRETILTPKEKRVSELAARMELPCPRCGLPLSGGEMTESGVYHGVVLICLEGCGFREY